MQLFGGAAVAAVAAAPAAAVGARLLLLRGAAQQLRGIQTYPRRRPPDLLDLELDLSSSAAASAAAASSSASSAASPRNSIAAVSRRQQWATVPIEGDVVPRSLVAAMEPSGQARIITEAVPPFRVVFANEAWTRLCGWRADEVLGAEGLAFMQGEGTDRAQLRELATAVAAGNRIQLQLLNYKKGGAPFINQLTVTPLFAGPLGGEAPTHLLGILREADGAVCELRAPFAAKAPSPSPSSSSSAASR